MNDEFPIRFYLLIPKSLSTQRTSCSQSGECRTTQIFSFHNRKSSDSYHAQKYHVRRRRTEQRSQRIVHRFQQSPTAHERKLRAEPQLFQSGGRRRHHYQITTKKRKLRKRKVFVMRDEHMNMRMKKSVPAEKVWIPKLRRQK